MHIQSAIMQNMDWDIYRFIMAVADNGSAVAAAEILGVNSTTVLRRINRFEEENAIRLFERKQSGYRPTAECVAVVEAARHIELGIAGINRDILGRDMRLEGRLRITTTDTMLCAVLAPHFRRFGELYEQIRLDVSVTNTRLNLTRQDADIAIRPSKNPPGTLVGQRVSGLGFGAYATTANVPAGKGKTLFQNMRHCSWVGPGETLAASPVGSWMEKYVARESVALTADTFVAMRDCAAAGAGLAVLPCCLGDQSLALKRVLSPISEMDTSLWVLTHADIRNAARVKAFNEFIAKALREQTKLLEGTPE